MAMGASGGNRLWADLCRDLAYAPAYAVSHLLDPGIFHFFGETNKASGGDALNVYLVYDSADDARKLIVLDDGAGYYREDLEALSEFEGVQARGWKQ